MLARNWAAGRTVRNAPPEMAEFTLLSRLGGYTRETLDAEPAYVIRRWLTMMEAEAAQQKKASAPKTARGRR